MVFTPSNTLILGVVLAVFGLLGWRRGVNRELIVVIGIFIAMLLAENLAPALRAPVNKLYRLGSFALKGGLNSGDPSAAWQQAKALPDLIPVEHQALLSVGLFLFLTLLAYAAGQARRGAPDSLMLKVLGLFTGAINGFLILSYLFPIIFTAPKATIEVPTEAVKTELTQPNTMARMVFFFVFVLITLGLYTASSARRHDDAQK